MPHGSLVISMNYPVIFILFTKFCLVWHEGDPLSSRTSLSPKKDKGRVDCVNPTLCHPPTAMELVRYCLGRKLLKVPPGYPSKY